jgi:hypothetical protein
MAVVTQSRRTAGTIQGGSATLQPITVPFSLGIDVEKHSAKAVRLGKQMLFVPSRWDASGRDGLS